MAEDSVRHPRGFEPPPWEAEQFERLARSRAADDEPQRLAEAAAATSPEEPIGAAATEAPAAAGVEEPPTDPEGGAGSTPAAGPLDEAAADVMLLGLRAEETQTLEGAWIVSVVSGASIMLVGLAVAVTSVMSLVSTKWSTPQQALVSGVMMVGALVLLGFGGWLVAKSLKTRSIGG
jgi:hypothetical protein